MYFLFPFHLVKPSDKIIIYGAGKAGRNYFNQIRSMGYCEVLCLADKKSEDIHIPEVDVISPGKISEYTYDYIVISQIDGEVRQSIEDELVASMGVERSKIISYHARMLDWDNTKIFYESQQEEYQATAALNDYLKEMDAGLLVSYKRIDICVRYLLFRDFVNKVQNKKHLSLFSRYTLARGGGKEAASYYSGKGKENTWEFVEQGRELVEKMKGGFQKEHFIPLGFDKKPYDGLHRIAAAMAVGEKIWVHEYDDRPIAEVTLSWFQENGFQVDDQIRILRAYADTYSGKCGIFLLYAPAEDLWTYMEKQIARSFTVVGKIDYNFQTNYIAFENVMRQVYFDWDQYSEWLTRKMEILWKAPLKYRILVVSDEDMQQEDFYGCIRALKLELREHLSADIDSRIPVTVHASDTEEEYRHLKKLFLSANNIDWLNKNMRQYYRSWFLGCIDSIKKWCNENMVSYDDVCVVGSAVLELFGIRDAHNFNVIMKEGVEKKGKNLPEMIEPVLFDYCMTEDGGVIPNRIVIEDDNYHTIFADIKFCNLDFVYRYKNKRRQEKDLLDIAKMNSWYDFAAVFDNKNELQKQIKRELYKRGINL